MKKIKVKRMKRQLFQAKPHMGLITYCRSTSTVNKPLYYLSIYSFQHTKSSQFLYYFYLAWCRSLRRPTSNWSSESSGRGEGISQGEDVGPNLSPRHSLSLVKLRSWANTELVFLNSTQMTSKTWAAGTDWIMTNKLSTDTSQPGRLI